MDMLLENITISGKGLVSSANMASAATNYAPDTSESAAKELQTDRISRMTSLANGLQQNLKALHNVDLNFAVHEASGQVVVVVTEEETGKVIREIPSTEMLNLATKLEEMMGLIFDRKI